MSASGLPGSLPPLLAQGRRDGRKQAVEVVRYVLGLGGGMDEVAAWLKWVNGPTPTPENFPEAIRKLERGR